MKIFLDTANIKEIKQAAEVGMLDGVTTNPTLMAKENKPYYQILREIFTIVKGPVNAEVIGQTAEEIVAEAHQLTQFGPNLVVKIPMSQEGMKAIRELSLRNIKTNATLIFSPLQAITAAKAGATYVSVFVGRLDDIGHNGIEVVRQIKQIYTNYHFSTQIIVASIRHPQHVVEAALVGADIATLPYGVFEKMFRHPLTDKGIQIFLEDWAKIPTEIRK